MNFVKAETLIQEITSDGKVRDIVTQRVKSKAEKEAEQREDTIRNLPEFKRDRNEGKSLAEQIADKTVRAEEEEKEKPKEYNVHMIDEEEYEHYQNLEMAGKRKERLRATEETTAVATFENERKRLKEMGGDGPQDMLAGVKQQAREKIAARSRAEPTTADRLRGRVTVRARTAAEADTGAPASVST
eukprot:CAMPEP_0197894274 /NCGR_PEP_ID=MMETSP1439-20131203/34920_1 /TAXON_ID=66791 /ORGANISM="Gonyaulax spinifera, Strain CCMP409" /LENGTH=186 /DNA_ID=CAMNT_0043514599 /DNA_START=83 /DNA_END=640 /DNA_ORIENTATION=+